MMKCPTRAIMMPAVAAANSTTSRPRTSSTGRFRHGNPPGWLGPADINRARHQMPIAYVEIVPVRTDEMGRISCGARCCAYPMTGRSSVR
ncbi:MAG: DUF4916 domain-containing protein [Bifidobacterium dentium]